MNMRRLILTLATVLAAVLSAPAQEYVPTPVTVSKEKVRIDGRLYYSHVVLEKQTLFGISKAYEVSIDEIYDANEAIGLRENGLKKNSIILIPIPDKKQAKEQAREQKNRKKDKSDPEADAVLPDEFAAEAGAVADTAAAARDTVVITATAVVGGTASETVFPAVDSVEVVLDTVLRPCPKSDVGVLLLLPFGARDGRGNRNYLDFYSGALLAARALGNEGINVNLTVKDVGNSVPELSEEDYASNDLIIGPVSMGQMRTVVSEAPEGTCIVSPLDARTMPLVDSCSCFIQAHGDSFSQYEDLVSWIRDDFSNGDRIILISETLKIAETVDSVKTCLDSTGLAYHNISYNILQGRSVTSSLKSLMSKDCVNRVLLVSESEAFVNDVLRNLNVMVHQKYPVSLYAPSKLRSFDTIEAENLHTANMHISTSYYVDYDDASVKDFLMKYRAVFRAEPSAFSYHGHDLVRFFVETVAKYGDNWINWLGEESAELLQTSFRFERIGEERGFVNTALRRMYYGPEYEMKYCGSVCREEQ